MTDRKLLEQVRELLEGIQNSIGLKSVTIEHCSETWGQIDYLCGAIYNRLTQPDSEPVGYIRMFDWYTRQTEAVVKITKDAQPQHGFTTAVFTTQQPQIPEGWKLVPMEPTKEMAAVYWRFNDRTDVVMRDAWAAMLAAAPPPKE